MPEWRVVIADDEPLARRGVRQLLAPHPAFRVVAECRDGREVVRALARAPVDVVILDIAMPGMDGLEVARRWREERGPALVFLTAHSRHALEAFEAAAVDYLVKPVSGARFARTVARLHDRLTAGREGGSEPTLLVATGTETAVLPLASVEWIGSADHYARVWSRGRSYLLRESLDALEARLQPDGFVRAHRGALIRVGAVRSFRRLGSGGLQVTLTSGVTVAVSRRRATAVAARLGG